MIAPHQTRVCYTSEYPLARLFLLLGIAIGVIGGFLFSSLLAGFALFIIFSIAGMLWQRDEPPVLSFAIVYQSLYAVSGYLYEQGGGQFEEALAGNVEGAVFLATVGFLIMAFGMRVGLKFGPRPKITPNSIGDGRCYNIRRLCFYTVTVYSVSWLIVISPMELFFNAAQIIYAALSIREVLLALLWFNILRQRSGYKYGILATLVALIPLFISTQSTFKDLLFLLVVILLSEWRPWSYIPAERSQSRQIAMVVGALATAMLFMGAVWEGAIKPTTRQAEIEGSPMERLEALFDLVRDPVRELKLADGFNRLIMRFNSIWQFALVLERVPDAVPHEHGKLLRRSVGHILMPRILFPDKENLGGSSWMATEYGGITVGEGTSVGIGYMAEFYVDFGIFGMFIPLFAFGLLIGWIYRLLRSRGESMLTKAIVIVALLNSLSGFEGEFAKILGGMVTCVLMLSLFRHFGASWFEKRLLSEPSDSLSLGANTTSKIDRNI